MNGKKPILYATSVEENNTNLQQSLEKLNLIGIMQDGWNDNNANKFSEDLINRCKEIVSLLSIQPEIFPTGANSIQFEYEKDNNDYLEFNIFKNRIEIFQIINGKETESVLNIDQKDMLQKVVNDFYN